MTTIQYDVLSPDGFAINCEPFASVEEAMKAIPVWCQQFKTQGYYLDSRWNKIPVEYLPEELSIVEIGDETDFLISLSH